MLPARSVTIAGLPKASKTGRQSSSGCIAMSLVEPVQWAANCGSRPQASLEIQSSPNRGGEGEQFLAWLQADRTKGYSTWRKTFQAKVHFVGGIVLDVEIGRSGRDRNSALMGWRFRDS